MYNFRNMYNFIHHYFSRFVQPALAHSGPPPPRALSIYLNNLNAFQLRLPTTVAIAVATVAKNGWIVASSSTSHDANQREREVNPRQNESHLPFGNESESFVFCFSLYLLCLCVCVYCVVCRLDTLPMFHSPLICLVHRYIHFPHSHTRA